MVKIDVQHDCTERELINDLTRIVAKGMGFIIDVEVEVTTSSNPRTGQFAQIARDIFELLTGDSPSYDDEQSELATPEPRYFQLIENDKYVQTGEIVDIPGYCFVEGGADTGDAKDPRCFTGFLHGETTFQQEFHQEIAPGTYLYRGYWPGRASLLKFYVRTNFDIRQHQLENGQQPTVK
jgi:hypothetical protein